MALANTHSAVNQSTNDYHQPSSSLSHPCLFIYGHTMAQLVLPPPDIIGCTKGIIVRLCLRKQDEDRGNFPLVPVYLEHAHGGGGED